MYPQRSVMTCGLATALKPPHFNHAPVRGAIGAIQYVAGYVTKFQSTHPRGVRHLPNRPLLRTRGFNPRTRVGCDKSGLFHSGGRYVSIHAPAWGATFIPRSTPPHSACFNPRTRVGCDVFPLHSVLPRVKFQSTHPRGVRLLLRPTDSTVVLFQSTHPRGVRQAHQRALPLAQMVSIHAPAWGATPSSSDR